MSYPHPPKLDLGRPPNKQFKPQVPHRIEPTSSTPPSEGKNLLQKSKLKAKPPMDYSKKNRKPGFKDMSSSPSDEQDEFEAPTSSNPPPSFIHPPGCNLDFSDIKIKGRSSLSSTSSFECPYSIVGSDNDGTDNGSRDTSFEEPPEVDLSVFKSMFPSNRICKICRKKMPSTFTEKPPTAARARYAYCQRHENASILQDGKNHGFPTSFDFQDIRSRIIRLIPQVRQIISRRKESEFVLSIRAKTSRRNAAAPMTMMALFEGSQPGYYGPRGSELISEIVMKKLGDRIRHKESLLESLKFCGGVMGYISAVIVPEVGTLLIMEDMDIEREEAKKIMRESISYGNVVNASMDVISSDDEGGDSDSDSD